MVPRSVRAVGLFSLRLQARLLGSALLRVTERDYLFELECLQKRTAKKKFRESIFEHWQDCAYCARPDPYTLDHVVPISKGGETVRSNLVGACADCNLKKSDAEFFTWFRSQRFWCPDREVRLLAWLHLR